MRLRLITIGLGITFLLLVGLRPDALPFIRHETRFSDAVISHWPNALFLNKSVWQRGQFPLWRETIMAGQPFAANPLNKTAYPFQWLALLLPPALNLNVLIGLHLLIAGAGMWRWTRSLGLSPETAAFSALAYGLAPRLVGHLGAGHVDIVYALAWWPWLMVSVQRITRQPHTPAVILLQTALFSSLLFLADTRLSLFALFTAGLYELDNLLIMRRWRAVLWRLLIGPIFLLLTASVLLPLLAWLPYLSRADLTPADTGVLSLEWGSLIGTILPAHTGSIETLTYLGLPVMALALIGIVSERRRAGLWLVLMALAALYALGPNGPIWQAAISAVPALLWFRVPSRAWLVIVLLAPMLAGYGLMHLLAWTANPLPQPFAARTRLVAVGLCAASVVCGGFTLLTLPALPATVGSGLLAIGGLLGLALLAAANGWLNRRRLLIVMFGLSFLDLAWTDYQWIEWRGPEIWLDPHRPLAERLLAENPARIYSPTYSLEQQAAEAYDLRLFGGVDPFQLRGIADAIVQGSGVVYAEYSVILPPLTGIKDDSDLSLANRDAVIHTDVLARWQVSHVVIGYQVANPRLSLLDNVNGVYLYANVDYAPSDTAGAIPDWPRDWPGLPDAATVRNLNDITLLATLISGISMVGCLLGLAFLRLRAHG